jgi:hypothetical protein
MLHAYRGVSFDKPMLHFWMTENLVVIERPPGLRHCSNISTSGEALHKREHCSFYHFTMWQVLRGGVKAVCVLDQ